MSIDVFSELKKQSLNYDSLNGLETVFLIKDFLVMEAITMFYGPASQGKTWFLLSLTKKLEQRADIKNIIYADLDNPKTQLKKRNLDYHFGDKPKITYLSKGDMTLDSDELLDLLKKGTRQAGQYYKGTVLIVDSTRDVVDNIHNDTQAKRFMEIMKGVRDAGGTILLIHHATKNGRVIDGSADFVKSADNVYSFKQKARYDNILQFSLTVENDRDAIKNCGFSVNTETLELDEMDEVFALMSEYEEQFVCKGKEILSKNPAGLGQSDLLKGIGYEKTDRTARDTLEKFEGKFWHKEKINKQKFNYTLI